MPGYGWSQTESFETVGLPKISRLCIIVSNIGRRLKFCGNKRPMKIIYNPMG